GADELAARIDFFVHSSCKGSAHVDDAIVLPHDHAVADEGVALAREADDPAATNQSAHGLSRLAASRAEARSSDGTALEHSEGGCRPPSEPPPGAGCAGKACARTGTPSSEWFGQVRATSHSGAALAGDEGARLGDFHALAVGGCRHREEPSVVRL